MVNVQSLLKSLSYYLTTTVEENNFRHCQNEGKVTTSLGRCCKELGA